MRIGIITYYRASLGSFYQANSLRNYLDSLGHMCEFVNMSVKQWRGWRYMAGVYATKVMPEFVQKFLEKRYPDFRVDRILKADIEKTPVSPVAFTLKKLEKRYDAFIIGSDEVWANNSLAGFAAPYFGYGTSKPVMSYSSTIGSGDDPEPKYRDLITSQWKKMIGIGVRDTRTQEIIRKYADRDVPVVLDPTMLYPFYKQERTSDGKYVLVYGQRYTEEQKKAILDFAKANHWKTRAVGWIHDWCDENYTPANAADFMSQFANASYSATSAFHGTVFSVIHHIPVVVCQADFRSNKLRMLCKQIGIEDRLFQDGAPVPSVQYDYEKFDSVLAGLREKSKAVLSDMLEKTAAVLKKD